MLCLLTRYSSIGFLLSHKIYDRKNYKQNLSKFDFYVRYQEQKKSLLLCQGDRSRQQRSYKE